MLFIAIRRKDSGEGGGWKNTPGLFYQPRNAACGAGGGCVAWPGCVFSRTIKLMLERQKSSIYQHEMLLECAKITPYQQDMSH